MNHESNDPSSEEYSMYVKPYDSLMQLEIRTKSGWMNNENNSSKSLQSFQKIMRIA